MNPNDMHPLDQLLVRHLDSHANDPEGKALADRILKSHFAPRRKARRHWQRTMRWAMLLAASILVAFLGGQYLTPLHASPEAVVRDALNAHGLPIDRLYLVETILDPRNPMSRLPGAEIPKRNHLWTRGDSFWLEPATPSPTWTIGRNQQDELWMALRGKAQIGIHMPMAEVPEPVRLAAELMTMKVETLLAEALQDFTLTEVSAPRGTHLIQARPNLPNIASKIQSITLEIDSPTRVVRRVMVERVHRGKPVAQVHFHLVETGSQSADAYQLEGHLPKGSKVFRGDEVPGMLGKMLPAARGM